MDDTPDYTTYTLEQLEYLLRHTDNEKDPDRFRLVIDEIERRRSTPQRKNDTFWGYFWARNGDAVDAGKYSWKTRDIFVGIMVLLLFGVAGHFLSNLQFLIIRPWLAPPLFLIINFGSTITLIVFSACICKKRGLWPMVSPLTGPAVLRESLRAVWYLLIVNLCCSLVTLILKHGFSLETISKSVDHLRFGPSNILMIGMLVEMFTIGPVAEELFFRGFLYNALKSRVRIGLAVIIQAAIFAIIHNEGFAYSIIIFFIGIALAVIYEKRKTLLTPILVHIAKNAIVAIPLLFLAFQNYHVPAKTWEEARTSPRWLKPHFSEEIERQDNSLKQWQYAIDKWGTRGSRQWKKEANGFYAVCSLFPEDRIACAKARVSIVSVYLTSLIDYRRAIVEADNILQEYPEQRDRRAHALLMKGWAYYVLKDFERARESFQALTVEFKEYQEDYVFAQKGIRWLNILEEKPDG